jgi:hypothetical protein
MMYIRTLAAALAISTALSTSFALAQERLAGFVRLEGHAQTLTASLPNPDRALFGGGVKLDGLTLDALASVASVRNLSTPLNARVSFVWTVKEAGAYAIAGATSAPWALNWANGGCLVHSSINGRALAHRPFSLTGKDLNFGEAVELKPGDYDVSVSYACRRDRMMVKTLTPGESNRTLDIFVRSSRGIRKLKSDEVSIVADAKSGTIADDPAKPRVLRPGAKREAAPVLADAAAAGWLAEYRKAPDPGPFKNRATELAKRFEFEADNARTLPPGGIDVRTLAKGLLVDDHFALMKFQSNFVVREPAAAPTWLAIAVADQGGNTNFCWPTATIEGQPLENFTRSQWNAINGEQADRGTTGIFGLFDLPATAPGAYKIEINLACKNGNPPNSNPDVKFLVKRPGDAGLRAATAADFVFEKKGD